MAGVCEFHFDRPTQYSVSGPAGGKERGQEAGKMATSSTAVSTDALTGLQPKHKFFVGIDSDGCAFDSMEIKHKECFCPNIIRYWNLQPVSKYAREAVEFINLYSKWRGTNRWPALILTFDLLRDRPEVLARNAAVPQAPKLRDFLASGKPLSNDGLGRWSGARL
jgi:hypothetical protein